MTTHRDASRIKPLLEKLGELWAAKPDMRLVQLIESMSWGNVFYMEDDELLRQIMAALKRGERTPVVESYS